MILLAACDKRLTQRFERIASSIDTETRSVEGSFTTTADADRAIPIDAEAVIIGPKLDVDTAFDLADHISRSRPTVSVLVAVEGVDNDVWRAAVRAGVRGILDLDRFDDDLANELGHAVSAAADRRTSVASRDEPDHARIVVVASPKGGAGKTVLATNLAVALADNGLQVVLVDLDLQFGDISQALLLNPEHSILEASQAADEMDPTTLKVFLTPYRNGLYVLCAPADPVAAEDVRAADVASVLKLLADQFDAVIVDTGAGIGEHTVVATETATDIILVASMDVPSVRNLRKALDILDLLGVNEATRHLVVNRADSKVGLGVDDVSAAAGLKPNVELPSARIVPISLNEGRPVVISHPRSPITRRIRELAETIGVQPRRRSR